MKFESVSIILPTLKETDSFVEAVRMILEGNKPKDIKEFIAVVCEKTNPDSFKSIEEGRKLAQAAGVPLKVLYQKRPYFGGAIIDGFCAAQGSHVCMVTPDLDTAPDKLPEMIAMAKKYPGDIVIGSRWKKGGGFVNYNPVKKVWNCLSQKFLALLYFSNISDFTWGNQLAPTLIARSINYHETKHPINIERVAVPLRLGIKFHEVGAICKVPQDGKTVNPLLANFLYLRPAFRCRFATKRSLIAPDVGYESFMQQYLELKQK